MGKKVTMNLLEVDKQTIYSENEQMSNEDGVWILSCNYRN
jgi:hypothetical protein